MPTIRPAFVRKGPCVFRVMPQESPDMFETQPHPAQAHEYEAVCPYQDRGGGHTMAMRPLSPEHCNYRDALCRGAAVLEAYGNPVHYTIFTGSPNKSKLCAVTMMAWYLADDDAGIWRLSHMCDRLNFNELDVAVWATVAFTRNMWALKERLSDLSMRRYLDNYYHLVSTLRLQGVRLHTGDHPVENKRLLGTEDLVSDLPPVSEWDTAPKRRKTFDVTAAVNEHAPTLKNALPRVNASIGQARSADPSVFVQAQMLVHMKPDAALLQLELHVIANSAPPTLLAAFAVELYRRHEDGIAKLMSERENRLYRRMCDFVSRISKQRGDGP